MLIWIQFVRFNIFNSNEKCIDLQLNGESDLSLMTLTLDGNHTSDEFNEIRWNEFFSGWVNSFYANACKSFLKCHNNRIKCDLNLGSMSTELSSGNWIQVCECNCAHNVRIFVERTECPPPLSVPSIAYITCAKYAVSKTRATFAISVRHVTAPDPFSVGHNSGLHDWHVRIWDIKWWNRGSDKHFYDLALLRCDYTAIGYPI